jgi:hypothetical protein
VRKTSSTIVVSKCNTLAVNPTIYSEGLYRFFFSREEPRPHRHVISSNGEAKFWLEPVVALADSEGLKPLELRRIQKIVERQREKFRKAWKDFFGV